MTIRGEARRRILRLIQVKAAWVGGGIASSGACALACAAHDGRFEADRNPDALQHGDAAISRP
jgi:hypothetical protein